MSTTLATFHEPMLTLNAEAWLRREFMEVTLATFHLPMSALNVGLLANTEAMLVTATVFQSMMFPYVVASPPCSGWSPTPSPPRRCCRS